MTGAVGDRLRRGGDRDRLRHPRRPGRLPGHPDLARRSQRLRLAVRRARPVAGHEPAAVPDGVVRAGARARRRRRRGRAAGVDRPLDRRLPGPDVDHHVAPHDHAVGGVGDLHRRSLEHRRLDDHHRLWRHLRRRGRRGGGRRQRLADRGRIEDDRLGRDRPTGSTGAAATGTGAATSTTTGADGLASIAGSPRAMKKAEMRASCSWCVSSRIIALCSFCIAARTESSGAAGSYSSFFEERIVPSIEEVRVEPRVPLPRVLRLHVEGAPAVPEVVVVPQDGAATALRQGVFEYIAGRRRFLEDLAVLLAFLPRFPRARPLRRACGCCAPPPAG